MENGTFDFTNVNPAEGVNYTQPGTIGDFKITECKYEVSKKKGTPGLRVQFTCLEDQSTFSHSFWLTPNSLPKVQHLAEHAIKNRLNGQMTGDQLAGVFKDKQLPLKVIGQIGEDGNVYADLPFGGFSANTKEDLRFTKSELEKIEECKNAAARASVSTADNDGQAVNTDQNIGDRKQAEDF